MELRTLPPYVAPEYRPLLEEAERMLKGYSESLAELLRPKGTSYIQPKQEEYIKAQRLFLEDPLRLVMIKHVCDIKLMVERPRILISENK